MSVCLFAYIASSYLCKVYVQFTVPPFSVSHCQSLAVPHFILKAFLACTFGLTDKLCDIVAKRKSFISRDKWVIRSWPCLKSVLPLKHPPQEGEEFWRCGLCLVIDEWCCCFYRWWISMFPTYELPLYIVFTTKNEFPLHINLYIDWESCKLLITAI